MIWSVPYFFFTVDVEEWHASKLIVTNERDRAAVSDFREPMEFLLNLLNKYQIKGTFFYLYHTAKKYPDILKKITQAGHEIALHGDQHDNIINLGPEAFFKMIQTMRQQFYENFGVTLKGYRAPHFGVSSKLFSLLSEGGFSYDSSMVPCLPIPGWYGNPNISLLPYYDSKTGIKEFPISVHPWFRLPGAGGYYFRNCGYYWTNYVLKTALRSLHYATFYIHPWELSNKNPNRSDIPFYTFRRTGTWARDHLEKIFYKLKQMTLLRCCTMSEAINLIS